MTLPFFIPDTSPLYTYSPCIDCAASGPWLAAFGPKGDGYDVTFHNTTGSGSSIRVNVSASSIEIRRGREEGECDATYSLDGGDHVIGCTLADLSPGLHQLEIKPKDADKPFQFFGIGGKIEMPADGSYANSTIDDTSPLFTYTGDWTMITPQGVSGTSESSTDMSQYTTSDVANYVNHTASITTAQGAGVSLSFRGNGLYLYGMSGPDGGSAQVKLDGILSHTLNLTNPWIAYSSLLFFISNLNESEIHELSIINTTPGKQLVVDYALLTAPSKAKSSGLPLGMLIGIISGVSALLLVLGVASYMWYSRRPRRGVNTTQFLYSTSGGYKDLHSTKASTIDSWRKNASEKSPSNRSSFSGSHSASSASGHLQVFTAHLQPWIPAGSRSDSPGVSPPPDYPDYLPYRGPIEPPPLPGINSHLGSSYTLPAMAGINSLTQEWLSINHPTKRAVPSPTASYQSGGSSRSARSGVPPVKPAPIVVRDGQHQEEGIPLESYVYPSSLGATHSPASTLSSLAVGAMTERAMGATRTMARLYPRETVNSSLANTFVPSASLPRSAPRLTRGPSSSSSTHRTYSPQDSESRYSHEQEPNTATGTQLPSASTESKSQPTPRTLDFSFSVDPSSALRRGVSIKSVKTIRSFFSGLLSGGQTVPETPAMPSAFAVGSYEAQIARPDSDIFPSVSRSNSTATAHILVMKQRDRERARGLGVNQNRYGIEPPPMLRLDTARTQTTGNMFIELDVNSPMTLWESRRGSVMPSSWRS